MGKKTKRLQAADEEEMNELVNFDDLVEESSKVRKKKFKPAIEHADEADDSAGDLIDEDEELSFDEEGLDDEDLDDEELDDEDLDDEDIEMDGDANGDEEDEEDLEDEEIDPEEFEDFEESDQEDENDDLNRNLLRKIKVNDKKIQEWSRQLSEEPTKQVLTEIVTALRIAVKCVSGKSTKLRVEAANYFNPLLKLVLIDFLPAIHKVLKLDEKAADRSELRTVRPKKSQYWKKYNALIKVYLKTMLDIVDNFTDDTILSTLLKHILDLVPFYLCYVVLIKRILKAISQLWSEGREENRVLSFLILIRMLREQKSELISYIMKKLYISYVKNCKFTNEENFAMINFMKQSLVELYSLDQGVAYQHAFIYIRQCAINLRTSMMSNKKEGYKAVYNWQYVHSLLLWVQTIACLHPSDVLKPLIYPLTQVILGTIKLVPSSRYVPLRLHLIKALVKLSTATNTFIPVLPYLTEILDILERTKKYKSTPIDDKVNFNVILKVPNDFVNHQRFAELCVQRVYDLTLEYTAQQSHLISFPELVLVYNVRVKKFLKNWKNPNDCKLLKQLMDKIIESAKLIENKRTASAISVTEFDKIDAFEQDMKLSVTPLMRFYETHKDDHKNPATATKNDQKNKEKPKKNRNKRGNQANPKGGQQSKEAKSGKKEFKHAKIAKKKKFFKKRPGKPVAS